MAGTQLWLEGVPQQLQSVLHCELEVGFQRRLLSRLMGTLRGAHCCQSLLRFVPSFPEIRVERVRLVVVAGLQRRRCSYDEEVQELGVSLLGGEIRNPSSHFAL